MICLPSNHYFLVVSETQRGLVILVHVVIYTFTTFEFMLSKVL